jgi:hypothetical protein
LEWIRTSLLGKVVNQMTSSTDNAARFPSSGQETVVCSLGMSCQSAHQLARFCGHPVVDPSPRPTFCKGPFDWLICPPLRLSAWLEAGLPSFEAGEIEERRGHAWWPRFRFWFWHGFFVKDDAGTSRLDIPATAERELAKLRHQTSRFRAIDPARAVFFISNSQNNLETDVFLASERSDFCFEEDAIDRLQSGLDGFFGQNCQLAVMTRMDRSSRAVQGRRLTQVLGVEPSEWKGHDGEWDEAIRSVLGQMPLHS